MLRANRFTEGTRRVKNVKATWLPRGIKIAVSLLDALSECLLSNNLSADDKLIKTNKIKDECILAISSRFSDGKASFSAEFCEFSRLQFPASQQDRAGELKPVR